MCTAGLPLHAPVEKAVCRKTTKIKVAAAK
jgi:hypothetical protein